MHQQPMPWIGYLITAIVVGIVLFFRVRGMRQARPLRLETLWIVPAIYVLLATFLLWQFPPHRLQWLWLALALAAGAALGWRRGALMRINVDPETHALNQQSSPLALAFIVVLIAVRSVLRVEAASLGLDVAMLTDLLVLFAVGMFAATRAEMFLRARRLLEEARAA